MLLTAEVEPLGRLLSSSPNMTQSSTPVWSLMSTSLPSNMGSFADIVEAKAFERSVDPAVGEELVAPIDTVAAAAPRCEDGSEYCNADTAAPP